MAPVLLDNRGLLKVGISILLILIMVFGSGFITGYQKAVVQQLALTQNNGIELPLIDAEQVAASALVLAPQPPETEQAGASIDVDMPDKVSPMIQASPELVDVALIVDGTTLAVNSNKSAESLLAAKVATKSHDKDVTAKNILLVKALPKHAEKTLKNKLDTTDNTSSERVNESDISSEIVEVNKLTARYSIQVGMYGRRINASNLVTMLEAQGLNAYISEYLNKQQQRRYNVRFGYFENKRTALKGLKHYSQTMDGKGYLVKLKQTMHAKNNRSMTSVPTDKTAQF